MGRGEEGGREGDGGCVYLYVCTRGRSGGWLVGWLVGWLEFGAEANRRGQIVCASR